MAVDWSALGQVAAVSIGVTVGVVTMFALGVRVLSAREYPARGGSGCGCGNRSGSGSGVLSFAVAGMCFLACTAAVCYGLYLIIPQLH
ncbi:hypothetical protein ACIREE_27005 [Streptomyces sp. NPDC102467]|uniref:hypothetical protein n=1 Tax=Streptomyces sp. NPDC102467 TaxID=3366179 RepID=UPI0037F6F92B